MTGPGADQLLIHRHVDGRLQRVPDEVAVEEPLEIRLDGHLVATTLRTPGNDHELAVGLLHAEGLDRRAPHHPGPPLLRRHLLQ